MGDLEIQNPALGSQQILYIQRLPLLYAFPEWKLVHDSRSYSW